MKKRQDKQSHRQRDDPTEEGMLRGVSFCSSLNMHDQAPSPCDGGAGGPPATRNGMAVHHLHTDTPRQTTVDISIYTHTGSDWHSPGLAPTLVPAAYRPHIPDVVC